MRRSRNWPNHRTRGRGAVGGGIGQGAGSLVNLSGQLIGIDLTGSARGTSATSYAIPVNDALAVARQLKHS